MNKIPLFYGLSFTQQSVAYAEKGRGALSQPPWLTGEKILGFKWSKKAEITLETISF